ncbi:MULTISPECIES: hypothetical protein [unclassified Arthrobacter]|uniref:hypothetical protein n=1 Tax=unclassified Arthrobacter TaxID=235627 RepID=UPI001D1508DA|nr:MULTISPECIES: hypothetical protein [unclassified Arthrobacter]MCC3275404.1 hypothetical protein [Arthrobacter sp. zg-Y20]MCC3278479.1 hypothetical protein [Arthrobacter sp. zg-Y40]MCC9176850.1 hypothetical protein [Arthrobacter sp. zg-Y750]MDK1315563.1 hypothetical protein [Arthrobacter sp. zg.Y20]MDK1326442.1 hypothetical protein [Arthrobacter sp. zg-Y1143]
MPQQDMSRQDTPAHPYAPQQGAPASAPDEQTPGTEPVRLGWSGGIALTLGLAGFLLTMPIAYGLFRLSLEVDGWTFGTVWMGPGWLAGLLISGVVLLLSWRGGNPKAGAWLFLGMFLLWVLMWPLMALAGTP